MAHQQLSFPLSERYPIADGSSRVAAADARGAATHFASNKWTWEDP